MTTAVRERHRMGINLPVLGLCVSRYTSRVHVYIGWAGIENTAVVKGACGATDSESSALPLTDSVVVTINVANISLSQDASTPGEFDVSDEESALRFAHFLLNLRTYFREAHAQVEQGRNRIGFGRWRQNVVHSDG